MLEAAPETVGRPDQQGRLPLHLSCAKEDATVEVVAYLAEQYPQALLKTDDAGMLPLHHACFKENPQPALIQLLLEHGPEAALVRDIEGMLPLQLLCEVCAAFSFACFQLSSAHQCSRIIVLTSF